MCISFRENELLIEKMNCLSAKLNSSMLATTQKSPYAFIVLCLFVFLFDSSAFAQGVYGYYRYPDIHENTIVFCAEGDIWKVSASGGIAQRLTTHQEEELYPSIAPDGQTLAFSASYEGPLEVYTMPLDGGIPSRWTYEREPSVVNGWTPEGKVLYSTRAYSRAPDDQLVSIDPNSYRKERIPLAQASEGSYDGSGSALYFVRPAYHRNVTKRYTGGTARQIWKFANGAEEAVKLTTDHLGESHHPMWYEGRVYFITDRDGTMNIWSMAEDGNDLRQHTKHKDFDVRSANISNGKIVYQRAADLWLYTIASDVDKKLDIKLASDLDQLREKWDDDPSEYVTSVHPDPEGDRIVITARGRVFVAPVKSGRFVSFTEKKNVRYRDAIFSHDGRNVYAISDKSGEFEFVRMPSTGLDTERQITKDGTILRFAGVPSPDGKWVAYRDLGRNMYVLNLSNGVSKKISTNEEGIGDYSWSPDSKWLAFVQSAANTMNRIKIHNVMDGSTFDLTTDRANSFNPQWSLDGKFIYFLSDRSFTSLVRSPWGSRQPEPYFDASEKLFHVALEKGTRSPFREPDELEKKAAKKEEGDGKKEKVIVSIDRDNIQKRIEEVPVEPGNYSKLRVSDEVIYMRSSETGVDAKTHLVAVKIEDEDIKTKTVVKEIDDYEISGNKEKLLVTKQKKYYMIKAGAEEVSDLSENKIDLSGWKFSIIPREDWKQIFTDAWRMERDYFYDKNMHGVDWKAMHDKYFPLVDRVTTRNELSDLIGRFVGELSALHTSVRGGDIREDDSDVSVASLGAEFSRDEANKGYRIDYIYRADPDYPDEKSPLDDPYLDVRTGDIITKIDGRDALSSVDLGEMIRNKAGKQVRLTLRRGTVSRDIIVKPIENEYNVRYRDWEYGKRLEVEEKGKDQIGYVHLRAMGSNDISQFYREFYPVFNKKGLIIDVRYNR